MTELLELSRIRVVEKGMLLKARGALLLFVACLGCQPAAPAKSAGGGPDNTAPSEPQGSAAPPAKSQPAGLPPRQAVEPDPPEICPAGTPLPQPVACNDALTRASTALSEGDLGALAELESCADFSPGLIRAVRADLGLPECADLLAAPALLAEGLSTETHELLTALGLAGRLRRLAADPPPPPADHSKAAISAYLKDQVFPWITAQATALGDLSRRGAQLKGYSRAIVAVEAGMADMRFVEIVRAMPIPDEMSSDPEIRDEYLLSLEQALEPRKNRGRDAALVGLGELAKAGVLRSPRMLQARSLLTTVFGGSRLQALDALLVPFAEPRPAATPAEKLARAVPGFYAERLLAGTELSPALLDVATGQGLTRSWEVALRSQTERLSSRTLAALLLDRGRLYFRATDFQDLAAACQDPARSAAFQAEERDYLGALGVALSAGPKSALAVLTDGPRFADQLGNMAPLGAIAGKAGPFQGAALHAAAYLRSLTLAPDDAAGWQQVATDLQRAAGLVSKTQAPLRRLGTDSPEPPAALSKQVSDLGQAAAATAQAIRAR